MNTNKGKIERLSLAEFSGQEASGENLTAIIGRIGFKINQIIDSHNELLDTHTVKEECDACIHTKSCKDCVCVEHGQPTTPEKKRCDKCGGSGIVSVPPKDWREGADYDVAKCPNCQSK